MTGAVVLVLVGEREWVQLVVVVSAAVRPYQQEAVHRVGVVPIPSRDGPADPYALLGGPGNQELFGGAAGGFGDPVGGQ